MLERVRTLEESGRLSGCVDDRGKYISLADAELEAISRYIESRGRVSVLDVATELSRLITAAST